MVFLLPGRPPAAFFAAMILTLLGTVAVPAAHGPQSYLKLGKHLK